MQLNLKSQASLNHKGLISLYTGYMSIGARMKQLRETQHISGEKFGELCGVTKGMVSQWENNLVTPPIDRLIELQRHIEFSIDWIYTGKIDVASEISMRLGTKERKAWYDLGHSLAQPDEGTNGKQ